MFFVVALALGCSGAERDAEGRPAEVVPEIAVEAAPPITRVQLYDDAGDLLASETRVAGLTLPMGLTPSLSRERQHMYVTQVPIARVLRYFGPRLTTGQVDERAGGGASYRNAVPREVQSGAVVMDVTITPIPGDRVQIEIVERQPEPVTPPSEVESFRNLAQTLQTEE